VSTGPTAAGHVLDAAADHYPLAKSMAARMAQLEVDFWQAIHGTGAHRKDVWDDAAQW
jgi:RNase P/RNase MRP subunit p30